MKNKANYILYGGLIFQGTMNICFIFRQAKVSTFLPLWGLEVAVGIVILLLMMAGIFKLSKKAKIWWSLLDLFLMLFPLLVVLGIVLYFMILTPSV